MKGFEKEIPKPLPTVFRRRFNKTEVEVALKFYLQANGIEVPEGPTMINGLEYNPHSSPDGEPGITMRIEVMTLADLPDPE
jgi:hypothetical protein